MKNNKLYESIISEVGLLVKRSLILEKYGLYTTFKKMNESDNDNSASTDYKNLAADTLSKAEEKMGEDTAKKISEYIKKAAQKSKKALYGAVLAAAFLCGTVDKAQAQTIVNDDPDKKEIVANCKTATEEMKVFTVADYQAPNFPHGGDEGFRAWMKKYVKYPQICADQGIVGKVWAQFTVDKNGNVKDVTIIRSPHEDLSEAVKRVLKFSPKWIPAKKDGQRIDQKVSISFVFRIQNSH